MAEWRLNTAENIRENLTKKQQKDIYNLYKKVYIDNKKKLQQIPKDGTTTQRIQKQYLTRYVKQLKKAYEDAGNRIESDTKTNIKETAQGVVNEAIEFNEKIGLNIDGAYSNVPDDIVSALISGKLYQGKWSLSSSIWSDVRKHQSDIDKIVAEGVAANKSSYEIAQDLEKYVNPEAKKEWDWSKVYPGTSKKIDYNAQRLARTMVSHAYQQSLERVCKDNPFVTGYIWQAAHSTRVCPICAERDGKFFKKGELPLDHPNGMCTFIADIDGSMTEVSDRIAAWANGKNDPSLDRWVESMLS